MKTLGTKLDNNICQEFVDICNNNGQTVSEKIRDMIQNEIEFLNNCKNDDKETIEDYRKIIKNIGKHHEGGYTIEDDGTLLDANFVWFTDKEKNEIDNGPKVTITNKPKPEPTTELIPELKEPKIFDCRDGNLYHDGNLFGKCADFKLNDGKVYDSFGNYLGQTRDSLKATVTSIE